MKEQWTPFVRMNCLPIVQLFLFSQLLGLFRFFRHLWKLIRRRQNRWFDFALTQFPVKFRVLITFVVHSADQHARRENFIFLDEFAHFRLFWPLCTNCVWRASPEKNSGASLEADNASRSSLVKFRPWANRQQTSSWCHLAVAKLNHERRRQWTTVCLCSSASLPFATIIVDLHRWFFPIKLFHLHLEQCVCVCVCEPFWNKKLWPQFWKMWVNVVEENLSQSCCLFLKLRWKFADWHFTF